MSDQDHAQPVIPSLGGRAGQSQQSQIFQYFALITDAAAALTVPDSAILEQGLTRGYQPDAHEEPGAQRCERLFRIGTGSQVAYRTSPAATVNPLTPDDFNQFLTNTTWAGALSGGNGWFRILVRATTARGKHSFFMDLDETIEFYAFSVSYQIVGPSGATLIPQTPSTETLQGNVIVDARIGGFIEPIEQSTGMTEAKFTQLIPVAIATPVTIPVPKFARSFRVVQDNVGAASGPWTKVVGALTNPLNLGTVTFANRTSLESDGVLGRESSLITDTDAFNARLFQVQWTIRP